MATISVLAVGGERVGQGGPVVRLRPGVQLDVVRQETFLPVEQLLGGDVELLGLTLTDGNLSVETIFYTTSQSVSLAGEVVVVLVPAYLHSL